MILDKTWMCYDLSFRQGRFAGNVGNVGNVPGRVRRSGRSTSYIYLYLADRQLLFLTVNIFIYWIFNVMFNPVYYHCHPFTDFYKKFICVEFKPFLIVRKSDNFIFWKACLLVVPAGFNPRTYNIKTLHFNSSVDNVPSSKRFQTSGGFWKQHVYLSRTTKPHGNTLGGTWRF